MNTQPDMPTPAAHGRPLRILMLLFVRRDEGTYHRAFPWARRLAARGHAVTLMCVSAKRWLTARTEYVDGVRIVETPHLFDGRGVLRTLTGMGGWSPLDAAVRLREIRRGGYDLVHTFEHHLNVSLPVYLAGRRHIPLLVSDWCDHYGPGGFRRNGRRPRLDPLYRKVGWPLQAYTDFVERDLRLRADGVTVISRYLRQRALAQGVPAEKICLIPGSADVHAIRPQDRAVCRARLGVPAGLHVAAFFGASHYDMDLALAAFAQVVRADHHAALLLMGSVTGAVEQQVRQLGLARHVLRSGWIPEAELETWLACPDVFILPMRDTPVNRARWPNKIGFHMAAARPTVCSAIGDVADLVRRERIGLVATDGADDFADSILQLFRAPAMAADMGRHAREVAERMLDSDLHAQALEEAYRGFATRRARLDAGGLDDATTLPPDVHRSVGEQGDQP